MAIRKFAAAAAISVAALGLSACATGLSTQVSRHQAAAIPTGQSFYVVPAHGAPTNEFYRYAAMVSQRLQQQGYRSAGAPQAADLLVRLDYGVDEGKTERVRDPYVGSRYGGYGYGSPFGYSSRYGWNRYGYGWRDPFYDPFWGVHYGRPYWSSWGRNPFYYGWNDPYWYASPYAGYGSGYGYDQIREYTVYKKLPRHGHRPPRRQRAAVRGPCQGALADRRARRAGAQPRDRDVHRLPGQER
jgi:hypothetical protein